VLQHLKAWSEEAYGKRVVQRKVYRTTNGINRRVLKDFSDGQAVPKRVGAWHMEANAGGREYVARLSSEPGANTSTT
jgi:hypothetical protein